MNVGLRCPHRPNRAGKPIGRAHRRASACPYAMTRICSRLRSPTDPAKWYLVKHYTDQQVARKPKRPCNAPRLAVLICARPDHRTDSSPQCVGHSYEFTCYFVPPRPALGELVRCGSMFPDCVARPATAGVSNGARGTSSRSANYFGTSDRHMPVLKCHFRPSRRSRIVVNDRRIRVRRCVYGGRPKLVRVSPHEHCRAQRLQTPPDAPKYAMR